MRAPDGVNGPQNFARYGLTRAEVEASVRAQGGRCLICRRVPRVWVVDHDHELARLHGHGGRSTRDIACRKCVRGLICDPCNRGLGAFRDDPEAIERAAAYVRAARVASGRSGD